VAVKKDEIGIGGIMSRQFLATAIYAAAALLFAGVLRAQTPGADAPPAQNPPTTAEAQLAETKAQLANANLKLLEQQKQLHDWPNLARYREDNAHLTPLPAAEKRVVFMGDSITDAWAQPRYGGFFPGKPYVDRGISGQTTPQMLIRFRPDVIALQPKVVVILAGTNDIAGNTGPMTVEEIEGNLQSMAELAKANGIRVIMASVMPVSDYGHDNTGHPLNMTNGRPPASILVLNAWIKKYVEEQHEIYLDYFAAMVDDKGFLKSDLSDDGLHPNLAGYQVMAPLAEAAIAKALRK
jgi:lysophospholipase L1-like esterase